MGAIVIRKRYDEGTESAEVATSATIPHKFNIVMESPILATDNRFKK
jgi:hypothetical protein